MTARVFPAALACWLLMLSMAVAQPPTPAQPGQGSPVRAAEQWVRQLENELDHLEEDVYYERGRYPAGLAQQIDQAGRAAAHFRQLLRRDSSHEHRMKDFEEMDRQVHQLVKTLEQSGDAWLRRQASRIRYPDEQLHYALQRMAPSPQPASRDLLARHAHLLESEARNLQDLIERVAREDSLLRDAARKFTQDAVHFHDVVERGPDLHHLREDFNQVDQAWHEVVDYINRSAYGLYLRRNAQNVNRIQNQIDQLLAEAHEAPQPAVPAQPAPPGRGRPAIEFEIPGIGRFQIPR